MIHGGDIQRVARETGIAPERILDFSANINPRGLPPRAAERLAREAQDPRMLIAYPDPHACELRGILSQLLDVPMESIIVGAGADSLIHAAVRALAPKRAVIPAPAFAEYARACNAFGCPTATTGLEGGDLLILNNPHNPTGACMTRTEMLHRIAAALEAGATVLADEAFVDYAPAAAVTRDAAAQPGVIAIRSLTKFYGCAGLRVGYAVASIDTARALTAQLPAWPVTTLALNAAAEALRDDEYVRVTLEANAQSRERLGCALKQLGCRVFPSAANFLLIEVNNAGAIRARLLREHGILVRDCDSFEGLERGRYLRIAVRTETDNERLLEAFRKCRI